MCEEGRVLFIKCIFLLFYMQQKKKKKEKRRKKRLRDLRDFAFYNYQSRVSTRRHCYDTTVFVTKFVDVFWYIVV